MRAVFLIILNLVLFIGNLGLAQSAAIQPNDLCALMSSPVDFKFEAYFDESFTKTLPYSKIQSNLQKIVNNHGRCLVAESSTNEFPLLSSRVHLFSMEDGTRALMKIDVSETSGKVTHLKFQGSIGPKWTIQSTEHQVPMSDGTLLRTIVYTNGSSDRSRVILRRTPYFFMDDELSAVHLSTAQAFLEQGYTVVLQAIRGTGGSQGIPQLFSPIEASDGADTVNWITKQSFSNGEVAAVGTSYEGLTALAVGMKNPAGLKLIISGAGPVDSYSGTFSLNGPLSLSVLDYIHYFTTGIGFPFGPEFTPLLTSRAADELDLTKYDQLVYNKIIPEWQAWATAWMNDDRSFFDSRSLMPMIKNIQAPVVYVAGLGLDGNMPDTIRNYFESEKLQPNNSFLVLGNWGHGDNTPYLAGKDSIMKKEWNSKFWDYLRAGFNQTLQSTIPEILMPSHFSQDLIPHSSYSDLSKKKIEFLLLPDSVSEYSMLSYVPLEKSPEYLVFTVTPNSELYLNGTMNLTLYFDLLDNEKGQFFFNILKGKDLSTISGFNNCASGVKAVWTNSVQKLVSLSCPVFSKIEKNEKIFILVATNAYPSLARPLTPSKIRLWHNDQFKSKIEFSIEEK